MSSRAIKMICAFILAVSTGFMMLQASNHPSLRKYTVVLVSNTTTFLEELGNITNATRRKYTVTTKAHEPSIHLKSNSKVSNSSSGGNVKVLKTTLASSTALEESQNSSSEQVVASAAPNSTESQDAAARFAQITKPWPNATTMAFLERGFYSGYRNQMMAFTAFVMHAALQNIDQLLLPTLRHKDTYGTNQFMDHETLFDVEHWNSYYPALPRMVRYDPVLHDEIYFRRGRPHWTVTNPESNATRPYAFGRTSNLMTRYMRYVKGRGPYAKPVFRNPVELTMIQGAMRPHPDMQAIIDKLLASVGGTEYMTLHARVEPDMQQHVTCYPQKERNLTKIFQFLEKTFPEPPAPLVFMPINRQYMEREGLATTKEPNRTNLVAVDNLNALNRAVEQGLWNGKVQVFEFGANALKGTRFEKRPSTAGAILNFYIALGGNVFVGTEVSSYSVDLTSTRFYRENTTRNYKYLPDGLQEWTPKGTKHAPGFRC